MTAWLRWTLSETLRTAFSLVLNGTRVDKAYANSALDLLKKESVFHIRKYVGEEFYDDYFPTDHTGGSWKSGRPIGVVDHYTAGIGAAAALRWFSSKKWAGSKHKSSAHFVIDRDATTMMLVDPRTTIAWHARSASRTHVGIEHVNAGLLSKSGAGYTYQGQHHYPKTRTPLVQSLSSGLWEPYTSSQFVVNIGLKRLLIRAIPTLEERHFVDHQTIDPKRKKDCGPLWALHSINALVFSWKPITGLTSLAPKYMTKNAVALFNSEVSDYLLT